MGVPGERERKGQQNIWRNKGWCLSKLDEKHESECPETQETLKWDKFK